MYCPSVSMVDLVKRQLEIFGMKLLQRQKKCSHYLLLTEAVAKVTDTSERLVKPETAV